MISFDVFPPFTLVLLDYWIDKTLTRSYGDKEIEIEIGRMWKILLRTKNVDFTFGNNVYQQKDSVAMGSSLGQLLAGTFMTHLKRTLMPELEKFMKPWERYVDDTIS